jgi:hypothetical protein
MWKCRRLVWFGILVLSISSLPKAARADSALLFLSPDLGAGARSAALSGAVVADVANATAAYWNPAGLARIDGWDLTGTHTEWLQDIRFEHVSLARNRGRHGFGLSFSTAYASDFDARDEVGNKGLSFGFSDVSFGGSYGIAATPELFLGTGIHYVRESIDDVAADGLTFDFGVQYLTPIDGLNLGAAIRNLGSDVEFDLENAVSSDLPRVIQAGAAYRLAIDQLSGVLLLAFDLIGEKNEDTSLRLGTEYRFRDHFGLMFGYRTDFSDERGPAGIKLEDTQDVSFGASFEKNLRFEYAFVPFYSDLGSTHRFSIGKHW